MRIYFAYGSNMDKAQMAKRCPRATFIGTSRLNHYKFLINLRGVATIVPEDQSYIEGVLWELTEECEKSLDRYEGISANIYQKEFLSINEELSALVYIATDSIPGAARPNYLEKIIKCAQTMSFSASYIDYLNSLLTFSERDK